MLKTPFLKFSFLILILTGISLLLIPDNLLPEYLVMPLSAFGAFAWAFFIILPRLVFKTTINTPLEKEKVLTKLQSASALVFLLSYAGTLGLYELWRIGIPYDKLLHFALPIIGSIALIEFLYYWYARGTRYAFFWGLSLMFFLVLSWEILEYLSDTILDTKSFGQGGQNILIDTSLDLGLNLAGILIGVYIVKKHIKFNP